MAIQTITYTDKVALNENPNVAEINKVTDDNMNEIKSVVNNNATETSTNATKITNLQTYSTSETNTGQIWIDGKPIYKKVINFGALPNATSKSVAHNISNLGFFTNISGIIYHTTAKTYYPLPLQYKGSDSNYNVEVFANATSVSMSSNTDRSFYSAYVILEYTKTTD